MDSHDCHVSSLGSYRTPVPLGDDVGFKRVVVQRHVRRIHIYCATARFGQRTSHSFRLVRVRPPPEQNLEQTGHIGLEAITVHFSQNTLSRHVQEGALCNCDCLGERSVVSLVSLHCAAFGASHSRSKCIHSGCVFGSNWRGLR